MPLSPARCSVSGPTPINSEDPGMLCDPGTRHCTERWMKEGRHEKAAARCRKRHIAREVDNHRQIEDLARYTP